MIERTFAKSLLCDHVCFACQPYPNWPKLTTWRLIVLPLAIYLFVSGGLSVFSVAMTAFAAWTFYGLFKTKGEKRKLAGLTISTCGDGRLVYAGTRDEIESLANTPVELFEPFIVRCSPWAKRIPPLILVGIFLAGMVLSWAVPFDIPFIVYAMLLGFALIAMSKVTNTVYYRVRPGFVDVLRPRSPWSDKTFVESTHRLDLAQIDATLDAFFVYLSAGYDEKAIELAGARQKLEFLRRVLTGAVIGPNHVPVPEDALLG